MALGDSDRATEAGDQVAGRAGLQCRRGLQWLAVGGQLALAPVPRDVLDGRHAGRRGCLRDVEGSHTTLADAVHLGNHVAGCDLAPLALAQWPRANVGQRLLGVLEADALEVFGSDNSRAVRHPLVGAGDGSRQDLVGLCGCHDSPPVMISRTAAAMASGDSCELKTQLAPRA